MVKELRDKTNAGMMDCKQALSSAEGNLEKAIEYLRKKDCPLPQRGLRGRRKTEW